VQPLPNHSVENRVSPCPPFNHHPPSICGLIDAAAAVWHSLLGLILPYFPPTGLWYGIVGPFQSPLFLSQLWCFFSFFPKDAWARTASPKVLFPDFSCFRIKTFAFSPSLAVPRPLFLLFFFYLVCALPPLVPDHAYGG